MIPALAVQAAVLASLGAAGASPLRPAPAPLAKRGSDWGKYATYRGEDFMDESLWDWWTRDDPTHGKVNYVSLQQAREKGLVGVNEQGRFVMAASSTGTSARGRDSVRIHSRERFGNYLAVLDVGHMPTGKGAWPAFWSNGDDAIRPWPDCGEIDILEGVHDSGANQFTIHTRPDGSCRLQPPRPEFGYSGLYAAHHADGRCDGHLGCSVRNGDARGWGAALNARGGGYFVTEFSARGVFHWFYLREDWPQELKEWPERINTDVFGMPLAAFGGEGCDVADHFTAQQFIFDITFCGDWLAREWAGDGDAARRAQCEGYVMDLNNNAEFRDTYWAVNSLIVYTEDGAAETYGGGRVDTSGGSVAVGASEHVAPPQVRPHSSSGLPSASRLTLALTLAISFCWL